MIKWVFDRLGCQSLIVGAPRAAAFAQSIELLKNFDTCRIWRVNRTSPERGMIHQKWNKCWRWSLGKLVQFTNLTCWAIKEDDSLIDHHLFWGRSEVVIIYPAEVIEVAINARNTARQQWGLREIMIRAKAVCDAMPNLRKQQIFGQQDADVDSFSIFRCEMLLILIDKYQVP